MLFSKMDFSDLCKRDRQYSLIHTAKDHRVRFGGRLGLGSLRRGDDGVTLGVSYVSLQKRGDGANT